MKALPFTSAVLAVGIMMLPWVGIGQASTLRGNSKISQLDPPRHYGGAKRPNGSQQRLYRFDPRQNRQSDRVYGDARAKCAAHFKSFDWQSGTYVGRSGKRWRCPYLGR